MIGTLSSLHVDVARDWRDQDTEKTVLSQDTVLRLNITDLYIVIVNSTFVQMYRLTMA